jgi:hypothetical protein
VLAGEHLPRAAKTRHDLVENEKNVFLSTGGLLPATWRYPLTT